MAAEIFFDHPFHVIHIKLNGIYSVKEILKLLDETENCSRKYQNQKAILEILDEIRLDLDLMQIADLIESVPDFTVAVLIQTTIQQPTKVDFIKNYLDAYYKGKVQFFDRYDEALNWLVKQ